MDTYTDEQRAIIKPWQERSLNGKAYYQVTCTEKKYQLVTEDLEEAKTMYLKAMFSGVERVLLYDLVDMRVFDDGSWRKIGRVEAEWETGKRLWMDTLL